MDVRVEILGEADQDAVSALAGLLPQLSASAAPLDRATLDRVLACDANTVLVARAGSTVVGMLTLVLLPLATGVRGRIEDVVVDAAARGHGVAARLTEEALRLAAQAGARTVDLTSRQDRAAANRLYERLGFQVRDSAVYRFSPS